MKSSIGFDGTARLYPRGIFIGALAWLVCGMVPWSSPALGGSIFDDDWVPPSSRKPATAPAERPETKPLTTDPTPPKPSPIEPSKPVVHVPTPPAPQPAPASPTAVAPARRPIPAAADQRKSRKLFKEVFATELADHTPAGRRALAAKLLKLSADSANVPADHFVLLAGTLDAAREASDFDLCVKAADALATAYDVDALRLKADTAQKMNLRAPAAAETNENCRAAMGLVEELVAAEDYIGAMRVLGAIRPLAADAALAAQVQARAKEVESLRAASERVAPFIARLKASPDDPAAVLAVGQYYCFARGDWGRGLPLLARCGNAPLKTAATFDLANPTEGAEQVIVGDAWWAIAEREGGPHQAALRRRAAHWYELALKDGSVTGLNRIKLDQRIVAAGPRVETPAPVARATGPQRILWFRNNPDEGLPLQAMAGNNLKAIPKSEIAGVLAGPNPFGGYSMVVWGINRWRELPAADITEPSQLALKQFVDGGGDLVMFEQFGMNNMGIIDSLFGIKTGGGGAQAKVVPADLQTKLRDAGMTDDILKDIHFFNSYNNLPKEALVLLKDEQDRNVVVVVPFGRGRLILIGTNTDKAQKQLVQELFDYIYHFKTVKN